MYFFIVKVNFNFSKITEENEIKIRNSFLKVFLKLFENYDKYINYGIHNKQNVGNYYFFNIN